MRIIIELDNEKSLTLSTTEKAGMTSDSPSTVTAQSVETVDGGAAQIDHFSATPQGEASITSDEAVINGGAAPVFANS